MLYFLILFFCHKYELKFLFMRYFLWNVGLKFLELLCKIVFLIFEVN